ncbi:MAG TPA: LuxR C-terminal-related transcriptional regulator [Solirubrobacteraceae bacterium]|nr:LuxR C-terminal-related transcriptional regulator [Solirubrobacteraceae bacterium]
MANGRRADRESTSAPQVVEDRLVPPGNARIISRPRLLAMAEAGAAGALTLVAGPAGSGKTVLLGDWVSTPERRRRTAWLTLDRADNDRRRFWIDLTASVARVAGRDRERLGLLRAPPRGSADGFVSSFINAANGLRRPLVVVLDDAHELTSPEVLADLDALIEHASAGMHFVISTRVDLPLRLQRLRVARALSEIRMDDLAFTLPETRALLQADGLALDERDAATLWEKTQGWPVAVRIAALSLHGREDPSRFVEQFSGDHRTVVDYLLDEVIEGLPDETVDFLLRTAALRRMSASLADAVSGVEDGGRRLDDLVRRNLLVAPADEAGHSFRYHPLFAEALLVLQRRRLSAELPEIHRRAARWYAANGDPLESMRHAVAAEDWRFAADLLVEHWLRLTMAGDGSALRELADRLPPSLVRSDPEVMLMVAGLALDEGDDHEADRLIDCAASRAGRLPKARRERYEIASAITRLYRGRLVGDPDEALSATRAVLADQWDRAMAGDLRAMTRTSLGIAEFWVGNITDAAADVQVGAVYATEGHNDYALVFAQGWAALIDVVAGRLVEARRKARAALALAAQRGWQEIAQAAPAHVALAAVALHWNDLGEAHRAAGAARAAMGPTGDRSLRVWVALVQARATSAQGEADTALGLLRAATAGRKERPLPLVLGDLADGLEARMHLLLGEHEIASRMADALGHGRGAFALTSAAYVRLGLGEPEAAVDLANVVIAASESPPPSLIEAWTTTAIGHDMLGQPDEALDALERALDIAEPRGYRRSILDGGLRAGLLLRRLIRRGTAHRALAGELVSALDGSAPPSTTMQSTLAEALSDRELVVLRYMPTPLPYAEVAAELFVSINTVKTHVRHVYRKLDVESRREAVDRARELRLLSPSATG